LKERNAGDAQSEKLVWRVEMFGGLRAIPPGGGAEDVITRYPTRKTAALLAYLAYHPHEVHSRDKLCGMLWPEADPIAARGNLRVSLNRLRKTMMAPRLKVDEVLQCDKFTVRFNPDLLSSDVFEFDAALRAAANSQTIAQRSRHLCDAVDLYRGELLPDFDEGWISPEARRYEGFFFDAIRQLLEILEAEGETDRALHYAYHAVNADPLREDAHRDLLRLFTSKGQTDDALLHYDRLTRLLKKHFRREPGQATRDLMAPLLPRKAAAPQSGAPESAPPAPPTAHGEGHGTHNGHVAANAAMNAPPNAPRWQKPGTRAALWVGGAITFLLMDNLHSASRGPNLESGDKNLACRAALHEVVTRHGGHELMALRADSMWAIFRSASDALACALALRALSRDTPRMNAFCGAARIALDTGDGGLWATQASSPPPGDDAAGASNVPVEMLEATIQRAALDRALSVLTAAHPGQTLCSEVTGVLLRRDLGRGVSLEDLGVYRLHDAPVPETLYQISYPGLQPRTFPPPLAAPLHSGELPIPLTAFFGRESEVRQIVSWLTPLDEKKPARPHRPAESAQAEHRLVTLTGFGGCGKTRLALAAARHLREAYRRAVWFVPLAGVRDASMIIHAVVDALHLPAAPGLEPWGRAASELGRKPSLLVLDNFEQVHDGGVDVVKRLLAEAPGLHCLITSRQNLGLPGERELPVSPLPLPPGGIMPSNELEKKRRWQQITQADSVQLFLDRARSARPNFEITAQNIEDVARLCTLLEGVPLAIELVAAHMARLTPGQACSLLSGHLAQRVAQEREENARRAAEKIGLASDFEKPDFERFSHFRDTSAERPSRHHSLRAAIEWSYELLSEPLRAFFCQVCVFRGGWTPEAAQSVSGLNDDASFSPEERAELDAAFDAQGAGVALDLLLQLQDRSLVVAEEQAAQMRFAMLEMLRQFAHEVLPPDERAALEARHAAYFAELAERASAELMSAGRDEWLRRLDPELDNLRAALSWSLQNDPRLCLQMAGALWRFWEARGHFAEGRDWFDRALGACHKPLTAPEKPAGKPLEKPSGVLPFGKPAAAPRGANNAQRNGQTPGQTQVQTHELPLPLPLYLRALNGAGRLAWYRADFASARRLLGECLSLARLQMSTASQASEHRRGVANALHSLGLVAMCQGDASARAMLEEGLELVRAEGDVRVIKDFMLGLALVKYYLAEDGVRELLNEALAISQTLNDRRGIAFALNNLGFVECLAGNYGLARVYHERSLPLLREMGDKWSTARALAGLGRASWFEGNIATARSYYLENITILRELGSVWELVYTLEGFAWLALHNNKPQRAARLLGGADALRESTGHVLFPVARPCYEECVAKTSEALAKTAVSADAAWRRGRLLSRDELIAEAMKR
jgi:predicted ATPase/DNA-binding SARP family transcriptional activator